MSDILFTPELTPQEMLEMGVFGGWYFANIPDDLPRSWFANAKLSCNGPTIRWSDRRLQQHR